MRGNIRGNLKNRVLVAYLTAGDPYVDGEVVSALSKCGVNIFEFGLPTTKPKYDGPAIKASHKRALESGATMERAFSIIKGFQTRHKIILAYLENALSLGLENFMGLALDASVEGVVFPDLLIDYMEELDNYLKLCNRYSLEPIFFTTSLFPHKLVRRLAGMEPAFIYLGLMASTGTLLPITATKTIGIMKRLVGETPLIVGFAISHPSQVKNYVEAGANGVVVGSALIKLMSEEGDGQLRRKRLEEYARSLKEALMA